MRYGHRKEGDDKVLVETLKKEQAYFTAIFSLCYSRCISFSIKIRTGLKRLSVKFFQRVFFPLGSIKKTIE